MTQPINIFIGKKEEEDNKRINIFPYMLSPSMFNWKGIGSLLSFSDMYNCS